MKIVDKWIRTTLARVGYAPAQREKEYEMLAIHLEKQVAAKLDEARGAAKQRRLAKQRKLKSEVSPEDETQRARQATKEIVKQLGRGVRELDVEYRTLERKGRREKHRAAQQWADDKARKMGDYARTMTRVEEFARQKSVAEIYAKTMNRRRAVAELTLLHDAFASKMQKYGGQGIEPLQVLLDGIKERGLSRDVEDWNYVFDSLQDELDVIAFAAQPEVEDVLKQPEREKLEAEIQDIYEAHYAPQEPMAGEFVEQTFERRSEAVGKKL